MDLKSLILFMEIQISLKDKPLFADKFIIFVIER